MLEVKLRFHDHCPRHPGYSPNEGPGRIKGGCIYCDALCKIEQAESQVRKAVAHFQELKDRYESKHVSSTPHKEIENVQPMLFAMNGKAQ